MKKYLILLLLASCNTTWVKPGANIREFRQDSAFCRNDAYTRATNMMGHTNLFIQNVTFDNCLESKGWINK